MPEDASWKLDNYTLATETCNPEIVKESGSDFFARAAGTVEQVECLRPTALRILWLAQHAYMCTQYGSEVGVFPTVHSLDCGRLSTFVERRRARETSFTKADSFTNYGLHVK